MAGEMNPEPLVYILNQEERPQWLILDRDGTLTEDSGYTHRVDELVMLPGVIPSLSRLASQGWGFLIATNQSGIARGCFTIEEMEQFHDRLQGELLDSGIELQGIAACPHHPEGVLPSWSIPCECRKPRPGLILELMELFSVGSGSVAFVGNAHFFT